MNKIFFSQLTEEQQLMRCVIPQHVSVTKNPDDEKYEQIVERQNKFIQLSDPIKGKLASFDTGEKIQEIGERYNLTLLQLASIARAIRSYYFGELKLEDFPLIFYKELDEDLDTAKEISEIVAQKIIYDDTQAKKDQASLIQFPLRGALDKYPMIGEQLITSNYLKLEDSPEPVHPSINNWLTDYTSHLGYDHHDNIVRGNYLFQNPNARSLSAADREKLAYILKAFDENLAVTVNMATKQIVFPEKSTINEQRSTNNRPPDLSLRPTGVETQNFAPLRTTPRPAEPRIVTSSDIHHPTFHKDMSNQMTIRAAREIPSGPTPASQAVESYHTEIEPPHPKPEPVRPPDKTPQPTTGYLHQVRSVPPARSSDPTNQENIVPRLAHRNDHWSSAPPRINESRNQKIKEPTDHRRYETINQRSNETKNQATVQPTMPKNNISVNVSQPINKPAAPIVRQPVFSSGQKLPVERSREIPEKPAASPERTKPVVEPHPYRISSSASLEERNEERDLPKNVVNLRE